MRRERGSLPEVCQSHVKTRTLMPPVGQRSPAAPNAEYTRLGTRALAWAIVRST